MANIQPVVVDVSGQGYGSSKGNGNALVATWTFTNADVPLPLQVPNHAAESFEAAGTFGGATITLNGSNDGTNYLPLNKSPAGTPVTGAAPYIAQVNENCLYYQPVTAAGAGQTTVCSLYLVGVTPLRQ